MNALAKRYEEISDDIAYQQRGDDPEAQEINRQVIAKLRNLAQDLRSKG